MRDADWQSVGVTLAKDVGVYDRAKLRLLNGPHSTLTYIGMLRGHETVADAMRDEQLAQFVELLMTEDLAPSLGNPAGFDVAHYISAILARFRNPGIRHLLSQIAWDGSKKLPVRMTVTIGEATARRAARASPGDAAGGVDALHRAPVQGGRRHRRSRCRAARVDRCGLHR